MGTLLAALAAVVIGAGLAVSAALTMVSVVGGPSAPEVAQQRSGQSVNAEDLAYGDN